METRKIEAEIRAKATGESRTITFVASTFDKDRHGTVLNQMNWMLDNFNANPIIGYQHNVYGDAMCQDPNPDDQLGYGRAYVEGKELLIDITFEPADINPLADKIFKKIQHGSLRAVSVGFMPLLDANGEEGEQRGDTFYFNGQELLEVSIVNIPSNPKALKKNFRDVTTNALIYVTKAINKSLSEIEGMTVRQVLDAINGEVKQETITLNESIEDVETQEEEKNEGKSLDLCKKILNLSQITKK